jgi:hypothetical protein
VKPVTADTITDEQIRELRSTTDWDGPQTDEVHADCGIALSRPRDPASPLASARALARARCAEIWNARHGDKPVTEVP